MGHRVGQVERAYRRTDVLDKRRQLMEAWAQWCEPRVSGKMSYVRQEGMSDMVILGPLEFHGAIDTWTEYLCMERLLDGSPELSSRSRELLGYGGDWWLGELVWPEGQS